MLRSTVQVILASTSSVAWGPGDLPVPPSDELVHIIVTCHVPFNFDSNARSSLCTWCGLVTRTSIVGVVPYTHRWSSPHGGGTQPSLTLQSSTLWYYELLHKKTRDMIEFVFFVLRLVEVKSRKQCVKDAVHFGYCQCSLSLVSRFTCSQCEVHKNRGDTKTTSSCSFFLYCHAVWQPHAVRQPNNRVAF